MLEEFQNLKDTARNNADQAYADIWKWVASQDFKVEQIARLRELIDAALDNEEQAGYLRCAWMSAKNFQQEG